MLTLIQDKQNTEIAKMYTSKRRSVPIFYYPKIDITRMNDVENVSHFDSEYLRDRFELSKDQSSEIFKHLHEERVLEKNQQKFFKVKRHINDRLLSEMDISDTNHKFVVEFDSNPNEYSGHELICSGTGSGKTYYCVKKILHNLNGKKTQRRNFIIFSAEWNTDKTLAPLKADKFDPFIKGIDCSESTFKESRWETELDFFKNEIKLRVDHAQRGTVILFDDIVDQVGAQYTRELVNKQLRTSRHFGITIMYILHNLRSGSFSTQGHNSVKYLTVFPRSQKGKVVNYLNRDIGLPMSEARDHVRAFAQAGRVMSIRLHAPEILIGEQLIRLL